MRRSLHAEWTKLRTVAGPRWLLLGTVALTVVPGVAVTSMMTCDVASCHDDPTRLSLIGVGLSQALVAVLAVHVISSEFGSGTIRGTLAATPHRPTVLAAKAVTLSGVVITAATVAVLGALLAGRLILAGRGFPPLSPADGPTLRATVGSMLYLVLIALLSLGVATVVRDTATSIGGILGLLYLIPILIPAISDPHWQRLLQRVGPMSAGLAIQSTTHHPGQPIGPWAGLGVVAAWAAVALAAGALLLQRRDP